VHHPDPRPLDLDHAPLGERRRQRRLVHVPVDGLDAAELLELCQHARGDEVTPVQDQVGGLELTEASIRQPPRTARQVRVGDHGDARQPKPFRNFPFS
jgi:hypothetical protein